MASGNNTSFKLQPVRTDRHKQVYRFHLDHMTAHLFPRGSELFKKMIEVGNVFEVVSDKEIAGICYITDDVELCNRGTRREFGGIFIKEEYRNFPIAKLLAVYSLASYRLHNENLAGRTIAHVHQYNSRASNFMSKKLNFKRVGAEMPPARQIPESVQRNWYRRVIGYLYEFKTTTFVQFSELLTQLENDNNLIESKDMKKGIVSFEM